jgi:hypothetical protein
MSAARALVAARTLAGMGYACFPCRLNKTPAIPKADGGNGYKDGSTDWDAIQAMWARYPGELVGVATGEMSGIAVVDIDTTKHDTAREWWIDNRVRLLPARVHCTQSGGRHVVYRNQPGLTCSTSKIARGVDVRADGGYIIWWPGAGYPVLEDAGIQPWPEWLMSLLEPTPVAPAVAISRRALAMRRPDLRPTLDRSLGLIRSVARAAEGDRNKLLFWAANRTRDMVASGEIGHHAGMQVLDALREAAAHAGLAQHEIDRTITSAMRAA